jgi:hypothetical protein
MSTVRGARFGLTAANEEYKKGTGEYIGGID